jgi:phenylpropionate dioxygenase-like ring-hydroxylating dioxygenase large terminal subunit
MGRLMRRFWIPALLSEELPENDGAPVRVRLLGEDLVAYRNTTGAVGLVAENCPHRGASLFFGRNEEAGLRCVYHGWKFDTSGACVDMPNEPPESNFKHKVNVSAYPTRERGGAVWAYLGPKELEPELPDLEWSLVPDSHRYIGKNYQENNWAQAVEGGIDSSHSSFLHRWLDPEARAKVTQPWLKTAAAEGRFKAQDTSPRFMLKPTDFGLLIAALRTVPDHGFFWRMTPLYLPFYTTIPTHLEPGQPYAGHAWVPIDDEHCWTYTVTWHPERPLTNEEVEWWMWQKGVADNGPGYKPTRNKGNDYLIDREMQRTVTFTGITSSGTEDRAVQETMGPIYDRTKEHLGTSDTAIIGFRRLLLQLARALQEGKEPYAAFHGDAYRVRSASVMVGHNASYDEVVELARERLTVPA